METGPSAVMTINEHAPTLASCRCSASIKLCTKNDDLLMRPRFGNKYFHRRCNFDAGNRQTGVHRIDHVSWATSDCISLTRVCSKTTHGALGKHFLQIIQTDIGTANKQRNFLALILFLRFLERCQYDSRRTFNQKVLRRQKIFERSLDLILAD